MKLKTLRPLLLMSSLSFVAFTYAGAQNHGPGGPPPGAHGPGGPNGPGGAPGGGPGGGPAPAANSSASGGGGSNAGGGGARPGLPFGPTGRWWDDKGVVSSIGLRREQQRKMDAIFDANKDAIVQGYKTLEEQKAALDKLTRAAHVDQAKVFAQIDAVSQARTALQKTTTQTLLQIRQLMDADQIGKLDKLR